MTGEKTYRQQKGFKISVFLKSLITGFWLTRGLVGLAVAVDHQCLEKCLEVRHGMTWKMEESVSGLKMSFATEAIPSHT